LNVVELARVPSSSTGKRFVTPPETGGQPVDFVWNTSSHIPKANAAYLVKDSVREPWSEHERDFASSKKLNQSSHFDPLFPSKSLLLMTFYCNEHQSFKQQKS
jgi:hypothetical protein